MYHLNHGQLGFALKDKREPDWAEAERELGKAIAIRGSWEQKGWFSYEFNRALCRIHLDAAFGQGRESATEAKDQILRDLRVAAHSEEIRGIILENQTLQSWMALNRLSPQAWEDGQEIPAETWRGIR